MTVEDKDRIRRAEEIQLYTENRCQALEKENAELKEKLKGYESGEVAWQGDMDATIKQNLELKEQNKAILDDNDTLNEWVDELKEVHESDQNVIETIMKQWVAERNELKAQIERLTCSKKYCCREPDGKSVPCFMTKLCADCQYREPKE